MAITNTLEVSKVQDFSLIHYIISTSVGLTPNGVVKIIQIQFNKF
jgi:hypothetical protein